MKKMVFPFMIMLSMQFAATQNLVVNPSFEEYIDCPSGSTNPFGHYGMSIVVGWSTPTISSDYYHVCGDMFSSVPNNQGLNFQDPRTGEAYGPLSRPAVDTLYRLEVVNTYGCTAEDSLRVSVLPRLRTYVPTAFSPNGDGRNDVLRLYAGPEVARVVSFEVYDRWGSRVYASTAPAPAWDGFISMVRPRWGFTYGRRRWSC